MPLGGFVVWVVLLNLASGLNLYYTAQNIAALPQQWLLAKERGYAEIAICRKDEQPTPGVVPLTDYLPFLAAD